MSRCNQTLLHGSSGASGAGAVLDMQAAAVEETALLQGPVTACRTRLAALLQDWPDHPLLTQLLAICDRMLGRPHALTVSRCPRLDAA